MTAKDTLAKLVRRALVQIATIPLYTEEGKRPELRVSHHFCTSRVTIR